jgi:hypothetical protein
VYQYGNETLDFGGGRLLGAVLPRDLHAPGPTPWDPALQKDFAEKRRIVRQERLLPGLIE